ncbi:2-hydroxyacid dehydrogenase [Rhodohalobacter mucosus]|uniref:Glyoxylate/hydroxypyruvate reductase A n=1 Tax=Rhodohalobacter mucosus TaxID=2079485 RepID=A0A316TQB2_9BACT|nr:glyoxylate/hydroxypyruvate reductase A [Rhodohalobacter mucosus]PWN05409.1 glyoxylate/hydroxypyruvate reductase A [Rhodohalobacter mucosus]
MSIVLVARNRNMEPFREEILKQDANAEVEIWPAVSQPQRVQFAVAWNHPEGVLDQFPNLKAVSSLGAGVDHILSDATLPESVRITRIVAPSLSDQMSDYILTSVLNLMRHSEYYFRMHRNSEWSPQRSLSKTEITIGIMGLGKLGVHAASRLRDNGFRVTGWARSPKELDGVRTYTQNQLEDFLNQTNILVCLLPLTPETNGILNLELFKKLKKPSFLINVARGQHLIEEDLIYALDTGQISHAVLDVFEKEPLPENHPFWNRKTITITPHVASVTDPAEAAAVIAENYKRLLSGMDLLYETDRASGY